jgi:repressor LexA
MHEEADAYSRLWLGDWKAEDKDFEFEEGTSIKGGFLMTARVIGYEDKKCRPVIAWDWSCFDVVSESTEVLVLGTVAAGQPIEAVPFRQTISIPKDMVGRFQTYALRVEGTSMLDENIQDGDFIIIEAKDTAESGETVVAIINSEEVTLKKLYIEPDHIRLQPANPEMKPLVLRNHEVRILGVVCGIIRKYRRQ